MSPVLPYTSSALNLVAAVRDEINAKDWGVFLIAQSGVQFKTKMEDLDDKTYVFIIPNKLSISQLSRSLDNIEYQIEIAVQRKLSLDNNLEIEKLIDLTERIGQYWHFRRPIGYDQFICTSVEVDPLFSMEYLENNKMYIGIITLNFQTLS